MQNFSPIDVLNDYPVCMYNCDQQKLVAVFKSKHVASKYVFGKGAYISGNTIRDKKRFQPKTNKWFVTLTFRTATAEQRELIPKGEYFFIIDPIFISEYTEVKTKALEASREEELNQKFKEQALALLTDGYCQEEIAIHLHASARKVRYVCDGKIQITKAISELSVPELQKLMKMIQNRINRISK